ncbi:MAG: hypothetical protein M1824_005783 [Vezdaea acicularis]|nr:MAG: hypothetical protein M1824_005783 [Vezdaea acicularis]
MEADSSQARASNGDGSPNVHDPANPVTVSLHDLESGAVPFSTLEAAFGPSSLGIILVRDLPPSYSLQRRTVLSYSSYLAALPSAVLKTLESPKAKYLTGWSHGKETLASGRFDTNKGSYYIPCTFYGSSETPLSSPNASNAKYTPENFPEYLIPAIWPPETLLPGFQSETEALIRQIIDVAALVARACDLYAVATIPDYEPGYLERVVRTSRTTKARLLHYFPDDSPNPEPETDDDWCATHVDHGCLTGLTSAQYINETPLHLPQRTLPSPLPSTLPPLPDLPSPPDPTAGLYILSRTGRPTKILIPPTTLAFQTGAALESITRGHFKAVPHFVRGVRADPTRAQSVARNTLAVFTQPNLEDPVDLETGLEFGRFAAEVVERNTMV